MAFTTRELKQKLRLSLLHPRGLAHRELMRVVSKEAEHLGGVLLDVGCGRKPYAHLFAQAEIYVGMDVPSTVHGLSKVDVCAQATALPFEDACFDSVLCTEVLEHTPEPFRVLEEITRVTKPNAVLLLTVPFSEQLHERPNDFYRYTEYSLKYLLEKSGWKVLRLHRRGGAWLEFGYRFSSFLYTSLGARQTANGNLETRPILGPLIVVFCAVTQVLASLLDKIWPSEISTIGYGLIAEKVSRVEP